MPCTEPKHVFPGELLTPNRPVLEHALYVSPIYWKDRANEANRLIEAIADQQRRVRDDPTVDVSAHQDPGSPLFPATTHTSQTDTPSIGGMTSETISQSTISGSQQVPTSTWHMQTRWPTVRLPPIQSGPLLSPPTLTPRDSSLRSTLRTPLPPMILPSRTRHDIHSPAASSSENVSQANASPTSSTSARPVISAHVARSAQAAARYRSTTDHPSAANAQPEDDVSMIGWYPYRAIRPGRSADHSLASLGVRTTHSTALLRPTLSTHPAPHQRSTTPPPYWSK
ncbi:hypothetical protein C8T65DRAFT_750216 [Cerioporus squamosus]|nr:hypothetical protein C8T65DRAFT_750216 [Cerioporus squamosus]